MSYPLTVNPTSPAPNAYFDVETTIFTQRELTQLRAKIYERQYPEKLLANGNIIPISVQTEAQWDDYIEIEEYDIVGIAEVIADYSKGGPRVGNIVRRILYRIKTVGAHCGWSYEEIQKAKTHNRPLQEQRLRALREASDNYLNYHGYFGDLTYGLPGILSSNISRIQSASTFAAAPSTDAFLALLNGPIAAMRSLTNTLAMPKKIVLPQTQFSQMYDTYRSVGSDMTISDAFLNSQSKQGLVSQILCDNNLKGAGTNGSDVMLVLPDDDSKICLGIHLPFMMMPEQQINWEYVIQSMMRTSLVQVAYPLESLIVEGI